MARLGFNFLCSFLLFNVLSALHTHTHSRIFLADDDNVKLCYPTFKEPFLYYFVKLKLMLTSIVCYRMIIALICFSTSTFKEMNKIILFYGFIVSALCQNKVTIKIISLKSLLLSLIYFYLF